MEHSSRSAKVSTRQPSRRRKRPSRKGLAGSPRGAELCMGNPSPQTAKRDIPNNVFPLPSSGEITVMGSPETERGSRKSFSPSPSRGGGGGLQGYSWMFSNLILFGKRTAVCVTGGPFRLRQASQAPHQSTPQLLGQHRQSQREQARHGWPLRFGMR